MLTVRIVDLRVLLVVTATLALFAPSAGAQRKGSELPRPSTPDTKVAVRSLTETLRLGEVAARVGSEDEAGPMLFASVADVALDSQNTIYVAESSLLEVRSFDARGAHIATFGRRGRGPGEFASIISLQHDGEHTLFAVQFEYGITEIETRNGRMSYRRQFGLNRGYVSVCAMLGRVFVGAGGDSGVVRELDAERNEIRAFGAPFSSHSNPKVQKFARKAGARVECHGPSQTIFASEPGLGRLRAYDVSGALRWETTLPNFQHSRYGAQPDGSVFIAWAADVMERVVVVDEDRLVVSVSRRDFSRSANSTNRAPNASIVPSISAVTSYVIDARTGRLLSKSTGDAAFKATNASIGVQVLQEPWPMLHIRPYRAAPR